MERFGGRGPWERYAGVAMEGAHVGVEGAAAAPRLEQRLRFPGCHCVVLLAFVGGLTLFSCACAFDGFLL